MRLIDAEKLIERINGTAYHEQIKSNFLFIANMLPTVDAVDRELYEQCKFDKDIAEEQLKKIVRCKDCKYAEEEQTEHPDGVLCNHATVGGYGDVFDFMHYCRYGERKEDDGV